MTQHGTVPKGKGKIAAGLLVTPVAVVGVLIYGLGLSSAGEARERPLASPEHGSRAALQAKAPGPLPKAWTGEALDPTSNRAILTGLINPRGQRTRFKFQYGLKLPYAHMTEVGEREVSGHTTNEVYESISHLQPKTTYHFRIIAFNRYGFVTGKDRTFRTTKGD
ncbi:MAG TPA: hypothetical protein VGI17_11210 [Solirubrobacterales bacterium]|jgi:hypothetical protein